MFYLKKYNFKRIFKINKLKHKLYMLIILIYFYFNKLKK